MMLNLEIQSKRLVKIWLSNLSFCSRQTLRTSEPPIQLTSETILLGIEEPRRRGGGEADHSPLSGAEIENAWGCIPLSSS
jgi:hypothetical protein